jgi:hypothetical protein
MIPARGFFVGSAQIPFSYQGVINSNQSQFSWNDASFMAANNGSLKKWILSNANPADGNANYDESPLPANFNDFFNDTKSVTTNYSVFVYQNGVLLNIFLGGISGTSIVPLQIQTLPALMVDMAGSSPDFTIDFSKYANARPEVVIENIGTDNGYIRESDGYCGAWTKSSAQINHSPGTSNGIGLAGTDGSISVSSAITPGNNVAGSTITYDIVAASTVDFPATMSVFVDNGGTFGQLDAGDTFVAANAETQVSDGAFSTVFYPYNANIVIQTISSAGCIDNVRFIPNIAVLPVRLLQFTAIESHNYALLNWSVSENENCKKIIVETSNDGHTFAGTTSVTPTTKKGMEDYKWTEVLDKPKTYYRLQITDVNGKSFYSKTIAVGAKENNETVAKLLSNPVNNSLKLSYTSSAASNTFISVYTISGSRVYSANKTLTKGNNIITLDACGALESGAYVVVVASETTTWRSRFIKR